MPDASSQQRVGDFYVEIVLPALATRLDRASREFGWKQDALGWVAKNDEMTHRVLGVSADRVVAHGPGATRIPRARRRAHAVDGVPERRLRSARGDFPPDRRRTRDAGRRRHGIARTAAGSQPQGRSPARLLQALHRRATRAGRRRRTRVPRTSAASTVRTLISSGSAPCGTSSSPRARSPRPATPSSRLPRPAFSKTAAGLGASAGHGETSAETIRTVWARAVEDSDASDALARLADQCGYSREAIGRVFRARYWCEPSERWSRGLVVERQA
jgi:hypothetical protein